MRHWNYRIVATNHGRCSDWSFTIRDVYYKNNEPTSWGEGPQYPSGADTENLASDLEAMKKAVYSPLLIVVGDKLVEFPKKDAILIKPEDLINYDH